MGKQFLIISTMNEDAKTLTFILFDNVHAYNTKTNNTKFSEYNFVIRVIHNNITCNKNTS